LQEGFQPLRPASAAGGYPRRDRVYQDSYPHQPLANTCLSSGGLGPPIELVTRNPRGARLTKRTVARAQIAPDRRSRHRAAPPSPTLLRRGGEGCGAGIMPPTPGRMVGLGKAENWLWARNVSPGCHTPRGSRGEDVEGIEVHVPVPRSPRQSRVGEIPSAL